MVIFRRRNVRCLERRISDIQRPCRSSLTQTSAIFCVRTRRLGAMIGTLNLRRQRSKCDDTVAVGEIVNVLDSVLDRWGSRDLWRYLRNAFFDVLLLFV